MFSWFKKFALWFKHLFVKRQQSDALLQRDGNNPVISPSDYPWESRGTFNPAAIYLGGRVHVLYRAMGYSGVSTLGYASSPDGIHFDERLPYPVFANIKPVASLPTNIPPKELQKFSPGRYASGGGWAGCEDPRMVELDGRVYVTYTAFAGWDSVRIAVIHLSVSDFLEHRWNWSQPIYLSPPDEVHKNWVMFPEKIVNSFAFLHNIYGKDISHVRVATIPSLEKHSSRLENFESPDPHAVPWRTCAWHVKTKSAGAPPIKTRHGWLVLYHAHDEEEMHRYKLGAMLLDLKNPNIVTHRAKEPILAPDEWYENDWKPGIIYICGAIVKDGMLFVYYGGGDKHVAVATAPLDTFVNKLLHDKLPKLSTNPTTL